MYERLSLYLPKPLATRFYTSIGMAPQSAWIREAITEKLNRENPIKITKPEITKPPVKEITKEEFQLEIKEEAEKIFQYARDKDEMKSDGDRVYLVAENIVRKRNKMSLLDLSNTPLTAKPVIIGGITPLSMDEKSGKRQGNMFGLTQ